MIVEIIQSRYTVHAAVLYDYLQAKFGTGQFQVMEPEDDEQWKIQVPRELTYDEKIEIQTKFWEINKRHRSS
ncbi:hypothetical protein AWENTII_001833 [Aspergillus wentii]|nr:hypothetical protein MW887_010120 [Aspergillus wentii]